MALLPPDISRNKIYALCLGGQRSILGRHVIFESSLGRRQVETKLSVMHCELSRGAKTGGGITFEVELTLDETQFNVTLLVNLLNKATTNRDETHRITLILGTGLYSK